VTPSESTSESGETPNSSSFLQGIEFLTGKDPNLGSFLLTVGIVTCVFIALFQVTIPSPVSHLLTAGVIVITVVSAGFAALLDSLGYFDQETGSETTPDSVTNKRRWVPAEPVSAPLPPMINFDTELTELQQHFDGTLPDEFTPFIEDYRRLKTNPENRMTIASDLRTDLNPVSAVLEEGTRQYELYQQIGDQLFRYIEDSTDHVTVTEVASRDSAGEAQTVVSLAGELAVFDIAVENEGEATDVDIVVEFHAGGDLVSSRTVSIGTVRPGATESVSTNIYVPESTDEVRTGVQRAAGS
jgi:hypothetical protein